MNMEGQIIRDKFDDWFGMENPIFMITLIASYLLFVYKIGPNYMKKRPAYKLKNFIVVYNILQIFACIFVIQQVYSIASHRIFHFWKCTIFERNPETAEIFNRVSYFTFWLKAVELSETVVFVLRKKQRQVSYLHVFHHCTTLSLVYLLLKHYKGGAAFVPLCLNCLVHIIMYGYYLAAAVCDERVVKRLLPVKKSITTIQMIQFVIILTQAVILCLNCVMPKVLVAYYCFVVSVIFYGFYDFYKKSYASNRSKRSVRKS